MATGWQRLGEMLAGGGGDEAYRARMLENARLGQELTQDDLLRGKRIAMETLGEALAGFGYSPEQARAAQALAWAGKNPEQFTGARLGLGKISAQDAALEAVRQGGGIDAANPYLAVLEGKPVATADIKGDTLYNPFGGLGQALVPTPLGEARIGERQAAAGAQGALDWRRRNAPRATGAAGGKVDGPKKVAPTDAKNLDDLAGRLLPPDTEFPVDLRNKVATRAAELYAVNQNAQMAVMQALEELTDIQPGNDGGWFGSSVPNKVVPKRSVPLPGAGAYTVGQVIEVNGKRYRVTGGDMNDPDVEEIP